jgi:DNA (cytosine-5)-methyltransferase 1
MSLTHIDLFCGFGGSSIGLREAGLTLVLGANHWDRAIETHAANFRDADHFQGDISGYDMRRLPRADVAWISPECTWHSPAGGRKRVRAELDLFEDYVPDAAGERSRATMWDVVRAAEAKQFKVVLVENVVEVTSWPLFESWLHAMEVLGYDRQILNVSSAHVGSPTNAYAPQWRDRIYFVFYKRGIQMPDVAPRPIAFCPECAEVVRARQSWKRSDRRPIGKYSQQYIYVCPSDRHRVTQVEPFVLPAASAIDWSDLGIRIGDRSKPLAPATMRRIEAGIRLFGGATVVGAAGNTWDSASVGHPSFNDPNGYLRAWPAERDPFAVRATTQDVGVAIPPFMTTVNHGADADGRHFLPTDAPLPTRSTKIGDGIAFPPFMLERRYFDGPDEGRVTPIGDPFKTVTTTGTIHTMVSPPFITEMWGTSTVRSADDPLSAVTAGGNHHGLTVPDGAFIQKHHGGVDYAGVEHMVKDVAEPLPSIVARANTSLVIPYRGGKASRVTSPLPTVPTSNVTALVEMGIDIDDVRFRMLGPREHLRAQRFPDEYEVKGNKSEQTKGAGNAVASNVAHYLGALVVEALAGRAA